MESIWWIFQQIYQKGLVYRGVKVMPYSTACTTALSNFESGQNYKDVVDPYVVVTFPLCDGGGGGDNGDDAPRTSFLAWTTTPWTLPANLALCVNPDMWYVRCLDTATGNRYILAESRLEAILPADTYTIESRFVGRTLADRQYEPLFDYFRAFAGRHGGFRVCCDSYVTEDSGTGIVHQAPYFGEDDFRVAMAAGIIARDDPDIVCPVDASGRFTADCPPFAGVYVKDADRLICAELRRRSRLLSAGQVKHSYPFCWRSDTPLIYKAVPSWFVRVEQMSPALIAATAQTRWVPDFVKERRFGNWLRDARDWAFSRQRYWGTPIPLWQSADGAETVCVGSVAELRALAGLTEPITDLHREHIDNIVIPSRRAGHPPLRRVTEVFDCWFESGAMPFAQRHYPFAAAAAAAQAKTGGDDFDAGFPADFIAEGIDQTRGWFYTLIVISTALFNRAPFKNLIANGLILAGDGQKMSKRKQNYPDPMAIVRLYGADALRLYLINSPVVRAENLRFKEDGVRDVIKDVFLPWYNAWRFLFQNVDRLTKETGVTYRYAASTANSERSSNIMDRWIVSFGETLLEFVAGEMQAYRLYTVVPRLTKFIDQLTNWYVRLNRRRIKGELGNGEDCLAAIDTLYRVLDTMVKLMAPFTPFLAEFMYRRLATLTTNDATATAGSVHYQMMPRCQRHLVCTDIERAVGRMQTVIELGRILRDRNTMPLKYPVAELVVVHKAEDYLADIRQLDAFVLSELNVRRIVTCADRQRYGVRMRAEPDHRTLGIRLKDAFKTVMAAIRTMTDADVERGLAAGFFVVANGVRVELTEMRVIYYLTDAATGGMGVGWQAHSDNDVLVLMDLSPSDELMEEGVRREIINRVQKLKKKAQLLPTDAVTVYYAVVDRKAAAATVPVDVVSRVARSHVDHIQAAIKSKFIAATGAEWPPCLIRESYDLKDVQLEIGIVGESQVSASPPVVAWANCVYGRQAGTILLQNCGDNAAPRWLSVDELRQEIDRLFRLYGRGLRLSVADQSICCVDERLQGKMIVVGDGGGDNNEASTAVRPIVSYANYVHGNRRATVLLENPVGHRLADDHRTDILRQIYANVADVNDVRLAD